MSLSGKLEVFPLEEVLRLLARSHQSGCLRVEGPGAGRIYLDGGSMTYAAVESDEALRAHLLAAGVVSESGLSQVDLSNGSLTEALAPGASSSALSDVIREQCVESVYRIRRPLAGPFSFTVDSRPRYATGQSYDIEMVISEADRRATEWADIEEVVAELTTEWRMAPEIEEESVKLSDVAWRFLAALEGSSSVRTLAQRLGLTDFQAARRMAELSRARLAEPVVSTEPAPAVQYEYESAPATEETVGWGEPVAAATAYPPAEVSETIEAPEAVEAAQAPDSSWWNEPETAQPATDVPAEAAPEAAFEASPQANPEGAGAGEPDSSFLESVFGELETTSEETAEAEESEKDSDDDDHSDGEGGFGLLRRRGLGAAFRELADS